MPCTTPEKTQAHPEPQDLPAPLAVLRTKSVPERSMYMCISWFWAGPDFVLKLLSTAMAMAPPSLPRLPSNLHGARNAGGEAAGSQTMCAAAEHQADGEPGLHDPDRGCAREAGQLGQQGVQSALLTGCHPTPATASKQQHKSITSLPPPRGLLRSITNP